MQYSQQIRLPLGVWRNEKQTGISERFNHVLHQKRTCFRFAVIPIIKIIDRSYISDLCERALQAIEAKDFDSAVTKSRTLLEEVFCYVIERKGQTPADKGDIKGLYTEVKKLYNMHPDKDADKRINMLLSGLEKILSAITEMRNKNSDSHGVGANRINIAEHHARLCVNAAVTMADFILAVSEKQCS